MDNVEVITTGFKKNSQSTYNFQNIDSYLSWLKYNKNREIFKLKVNDKELPKDSFKNLIH